MSVGLVAVGDSGVAIHSGDGKTWAVQATPVATQLNGVRYAQGQFLAPGAGGVIITSPDGLSGNWTSQTTGTAADLFKPWFSDNLWVVPGNNVIRRSADGITWLGVAGPFAVDQNGIAKDASNYVVVANGGSLATSPDATTWTPRTSNTVENLLDVVYAPWLSLFVAVGDNGAIITSPDGITAWTVQISNTSSDLRAVTVDTVGQRIVAAGENGTIVTSTNGTLWSLQAASTTVDQWEGVFFDADGLYVVVGSPATALQIINTSLDATAWTLESGAGTDELRGVSGSLPPGAAEGAGGGGYGVDGWGTDPYGSTIPQSPLAMQAALAITTKEVRVTLNRAPQVIASTVAGDALNPNTWTIQRLDNGFLFSVLSVVQTDEEVFTLSVLQDFGSATVQHRVLTTTLLDAEGNPISQPPLNQTDFAGLLASETKDETARAARRLNQVRDIANPQVPSSGNTAGTIIGGTLVINSAGDYEVEGGASLTKKLIIRRLITQPGEFSHLPNYGVGIGVKEVLPAANMIKLRADIIKEVRKEKEVSTVDVQLILGAQNDLTITIKATTITGENLDFSIPVPSREVVL